MKLGDSELLQQKANAERLVRDRKAPCGSLSSETGAEPRQLHPDANLRLLGKVGNTTAAGLVSDDAALRTALVSGINFR
jgi:hypothetical protein